MPDNFDFDTFEQESVNPCVGGDCGKSVIVNNNEGDGDCCIPGPQGPAGPAGSTGPQGKQGEPGPKGRPPSIRCGCLPKNEADGGSGGPIQQQCIDNITGKVVFHSNNVDYFTSKTTPNTFTQQNCDPGAPNTYCSYFNISSPSLQNPPYGQWGNGNGIGSPSNSLEQKPIVAWGYIGTGNVPNVNYTWSYAQFKVIAGLQPNNLSATAGGPFKFTFMPTDSLFTGNGQIDLSEWKSLIEGSPSQELVDAFLFDFPECATDGTGAPPSPKNGQGESICGSLDPTNGEEECTCEGCSPDNQLKNCNDVQVGDIFVDACNKIMYIAGEGGWPKDGIPFGPEDKICPPKEECPVCPECPPPNCSSCSCSCADANIPEAVCNCISNINELLGADCTCKSSPGKNPKCPSECPESPGSYYYQDASKECPCGKDQTYVGCVNCAKAPTIICECAEGKTAGCCDNVAPTCESLNCPSACPVQPDGSCVPICSTLLEQLVSSNCPCVDIASVAFGLNCINCDNFALDAICPSGNCCKNTSGVIPALLIGE